MYQHGNLVICPNGKTGYVINMLGLRHVAVILSNGKNAVFPVSDVMPTDFAR